MKVIVDKTRRQQPSFKIKLTDEMPLVIFKINCTCLLLSYPIVYF